MKGRERQARLQRRYGGQFVALRRGRVVAHAKTLRAVARAIKALGVEPSAVVFAHVESPESVCVYRLPAR